MKFVVHWKAVCFGTVINNVGYTTSSQLTSLTFDKEPSLTVLVRLVSKSTQQHKQNLLMLAICLFFFPKKKRLFNLISSDNR